MAKNMYGVPYQHYAVLGNFVYSADGNGLIANVTDEHAPDLMEQRCLDEDAWLKLQAAHPGAGGAMLQATIRLTATQMIHLHSAPVSFLPSPGPGNVIYMLVGAGKHNFGTRPFESSASILLQYHGTAIHSGLTANPFTESANTYVAGDISGVLDVNRASTTIDNLGIDITANVDMDAGSISTSSLDLGGASYAIGDTGSVNDGASDAVYQVDTVDGGGAILTYHLTNAGTRCTVGSGVTTSVTTGSGDGNFTIDIASVLQGDGTGVITLLYAILPLT